MGRNIFTHECPEEITYYQDHMDPVDRDDQKHLQGSGFCSKSHYKKWYKKGHLGVADFGLFNSNCA
eukprot:12089469-Ditylum_brightwellii.AAC.1